MLKEGFLLGTIRHNRYIPKSHIFCYSMYWSLLDLDTIPTQSKKYRYLSSESWNILSFRKNDFFRIGEKSNKESIQSFIKTKTGKPFSGKVFLLSHLRFLGFNFNSVSFYFCINQQGELEHIISEITNTPWGERHPYLLTCSEDQKRTNCYIFNFDKEFHISPFISMNMDYQWLFKIEEQKLRIHMQVMQKALEDNEQAKVIDVTFTANHIPLTQNNLNKMILKYPFQPLKMVWGIYWQALKLRLKKTPFYSHPKYNSKNG